MKKLLLWTLWLWISITLWAAFFYAPPAGGGFIGNTSRILFFHVPLAWASFIAFMAAGAWSLRYLFFSRDPRHDRAAYAAVEVGVVFCVLATITGAIWAKVQWGAYWNWDPRQVWITVAILYYAAYLALRSAVVDEDARRRLSGAYAVLGLVVAPFLFFILPRMSGFTLHPEPVVNQQGELDMTPKIAQVLLAGSLGVMVLFFWIHNLRCRLLGLEEENGTARA